MTTTLPTIIDHPGRNRLVQIDIEPLPGGLFMLDVQAERRGQPDQVTETDVTADCLRRMRARIDELLGDAS
jgi:hypothetical protein